MTFEEQINDKIRFVEGLEKLIETSTDEEAISFYKGCLNATLYGNAKPHVAEVAYSVPIGSHYELRIKKWRY